MERGSYLRIAEVLRQRIAGGDLANGRYLPTERELQEEFGVSRSTIRRALAQLVQSGIAESVPSKGVLASGDGRILSSPNIALIDGSTYVLRVLFVRLSEQLRRLGYHLIHLGGSNEGSIESSLEYAMSQGFVGAFVWPFRGFPDETVLRRAAESMAVVTLDHSMRGVQTDLVSFDYLSAADEVTELLIRNGCRRIGVTGMIDMIDVTWERFAGYMRAMFRNGLTPNAVDFTYIVTSGMESPDIELLRYRLRQPDRPDGFLVLQDESIPPVIEAIHAAGLSVPRDVKLVTIGDDLEINIGEAGLSAVALDWEAFANMAVELMVRRVCEDSPALERRVAPHRLIVRGLCGASKERWTPRPDQVTGFVGELPFPRNRYRFTDTASEIGDAITNSPKRAQYETSLHAH